MNIMVSKNIVFVIISTIFLLSLITGIGIKMHRDGNKKFVKKSYLLKFSVNRLSPSEQAPRSITTSTVINNEQETVKTCNATIVTAYFKIPSKHTSEEYIQWMENFLTLKDCMVIFTHVEMTKIIGDRRPQIYPTKIVTMHLDEVSSI